MPDKKTEQPWERQEGESAQAFEAFALYLEMGAGRSVRTVAQKLYKSDTLIGRWSRTYRWVERCRAWDNHLQREAQKNAIAGKRDMVRRHIELANLLQSIVLEAITEGGTDMITPQNLASVMKLATSLERESREADVEACGGALAEEGEKRNNLLEVIMNAGEINTDDLPEVE